MNALLVSFAFASVSVLIFVYFTPRDGEHKKNIYVYIACKGIWKTTDRSIEELAGPPRPVDKITEMGAPHFEKKETKSSFLPEGWFSNCFTPHPSPHACS